MSNTRAISFPGGNAFVSQVGARVELTLNDWEEGTHANLTPEEALALACALTESALAARQAATVLVAPDRSGCELTS